METERFNEHIVYNHHCPVIRYKLAPYFSVHGAILAKHHRGQWNEEDGMLAQGREAKVTRFLHVSSVHDAKQAEDGNVGLLCLFLKTTMENFWLEYICCSRVLQRRSSFMQSLLIFLTIRDLCKFLFEVRRKDEDEERKTTKLKCGIALLFVNHTYRYGESSRWINWLIRVLSLRKER